MTILLPNSEIGLPVGCYYLTNLAIPDGPDDIRLAGMLYDRLRLMIEVTKTYVIVANYSGTPTQLINPHVRGVQPRFYSMEPFSLYNVQIDERVRISFPCETEKGFALAILDIHSTSSSGKAWIKLFIKQ